MGDSYADFLAGKQTKQKMLGFAPVFMPKFLFDFQSELTEWSIRKGRAAVFADCGL